MQRLQFLRYTSGCLLSSGLLGCQPFQGLWPKKTAAFNCQATHADALGPFYIEQTPYLTALNSPELPGIKMRVYGRVLDAISGKGIVKARIDVWHADHFGRYHPQSNGQFSDFSPAEINLRGQLRSNQQGAYQFSSIYPGLYPTRPRHIHFKLSAPGYQSVVTQSYFKEDPQSPHIAVRQSQASCLLIDFVLDNHNTMQGEVNFFLMPQTS